MITTYNVSSFLILVSAAVTVSHSFTLFSNMPGYHVISLRSNFETCSHPIDAVGDCFVFFLFETFSHPVDAGGDGGEVGAFVFLLDEVAEAGKKASLLSNICFFCKTSQR